MTIIKDDAMTHAGKFHADDVFSAALLRMQNPNIKFERVLEVPSNFDGIVFDIGKGKFDHHQEDAECRENGVKYAAFGLLWREFGASIVGEDEAKLFDEHFVQPIDLDDNTGCGNQISGIIGQFNPVWDSQEDRDTCFLKAVEIAQAILTRKFESAHAMRRAKSIIETGLQEMKNKTVVLPKFAPWGNVLIESDANFVVYPSERGGYCAQAIRDSVDKRTSKLKIPFPAKWAGKSREELGEISGINTLNFCHNSLFLISCDRLEDCIKATEIAAIPVQLN